MGIAIGEIELRHLAEEREVIAAMTSQSEPVRGGVEGSGWGIFTGSRQINEHVGLWVGVMDLRPCD